MPVGEFIGVGTWGLSGEVHGPIGRAEAQSLLQYALSRGVRSIDTSPLYGRGTVESLVGALLSPSYRDSVNLVTKFGLYSTGSVEYRDYSWQRTKAELEKSLDRLQTHYLNVYLAHSPHLDSETERRSLVQTLEELRNDSRVKKIGISLINPEDVRWLRYLPKMEVIELNLSLMDQRLTYSPFWKNFEDAKPTVIARTPLNYGYLALNDEWEDRELSPRIKAFSPEWQDFWLRSWREWHKIATSLGASVY